MVVAGIGLFFFDTRSVRGTLGILVGLVESVFWAGAMIFLPKSRNGSTAWPIALGNFMAAGLGVNSLGAGYAVFAYASKRIRALEALLIPPLLWQPTIEPTPFFPNRPTTI